MMIDQKFDQDKKVACLSAWFKCGEDEQSIANARYPEFILYYNGYKFSMTKHYRATHYYKCKQRYRSKCHMGICIKWNLDRTIRSIEVKGEHVNEYCQQSIQTHPFSLLDSFITSKTQFIFNGKPTSCGDVRILSHPISIQNALKTKKKRITKTLKIYENDLKDKQNDIIVQYNGFHYKRTADIKTNAYACIAKKCMACIFASSDFKMIKFKNNHIKHVQTTLSADFEYRQEITDFQINTIAHCMSFLFMHLLNT